MANRHLSRSIALQSLFEWDFRAYSLEAMRPVILRNIAEFGPGLDDVDFVHQLVENVLRRRDQLDLIIGKAAPDWPIAQIAMVDRNVLRLGLCELLFADRGEVPARVAINEAIELAKTFGGENSGKFVNGVLGAVYKEMGEPGKDDIPAKKKLVKDIPYEEMPILKLGGAVVYARHEDQIYLALVHDIFNYWTLSKGKIDATEDEKVATARKIKEEIGLAISVQDHLGANEYISSDPEKGKLRKQVNYFLAEAPYETLTLGESGGLSEARWFPLNEITDLRMYDDVVPFVTKALKILSAKNKSNAVAK